MNTMFAQLFKKGVSIMKEKKNVMYVLSALACVMLLWPAAGLANTSELVGLLTSQLGGLGTTGGRGRRCVISGCKEKSE